MSNNIFFVHACQKENTALAVFSFCIAAADENCKFGDVGMREARARGALRRRRKPCRGRAGSTRSERFMVRRAVRILLCLRQACAVTFTAREQLSHSRPRMRVSARESRSDEKNFYI